MKDKIQTVWKYLAESDKDPAWLKKYANTNTERGRLYMTLNFLEGMIRKLEKENSKGGGLE